MIHLLIHFHCAKLLINIAVAPSTSVLRFFDAKSPEPSDSTVALQVLEQEVTSAIAQVRITM